MRGLWTFVLVITLSLARCQKQAKPAAGQDTRASVTDLVDKVFPVDGTGTENGNLGQEPVQPVQNGDPVQPVGGHVDTGAQVPMQYGCEPGFDCVPYYLCSNVTNTIIKDGYGIIDIRGQFEGGCEDYLEQCCRVSDQTDVPVVTPRPTPSGCGFRNVDGVGFRITGNKDNETEFGEFPWMVAILMEEVALDQVLNIYKCGGSLIAPNVVLTGAHCVNAVPPAKLKVRAGEWDTQTKNELLADQDREVVEVIVHPHYYKGGLFNDVALLFLRGEFELAEHIKPVCLPPPDFNFDHSRCFTTGWGKDVFGQLGRYQVILKKIDLPIIPRPVCQNQLRATRLGKHFELHPTFICAGGEPGKDACKGDGGSPLVCPIPNTVNRYYQAGLVAWGIGCGDANVPGVYVNIPKLMPWISEQLEYKRIDSTFYTLL